MAHKLAVFNMKGSGGFANTAYNLATGLVKFHQQRILIVDIDPQGNSAASLGISIWEFKTQLKDILQRQASMPDEIVSTPSGVDVVPSNILMAEEAIPITGLPGRELPLRKAIAMVDAQYNFILIDCPPNVGVFTVNAGLSRPPDRGGWRIGDPLQRTQQPK
jgi:chromosome partitioning protein